MTNSGRIVTIVIIIIVIVLGLGWFLINRGLIPSLKIISQNTDQAVVESAESAVFLVNGQVYFGKLSFSKNQFITLRDIYYLQLAQSPQPENATKNNGEQPQLSLVKLGDELHGPTDEMKINRDQILFIEKLKENSKVVEAIKRYEKEGPAILSTASPTPKTP